MDVEEDWCRPRGESFREQDVEGDGLGVNCFVGGGRYAEGGVDFRIHF